MKKVPESHSAINEPQRIDSAPPVGVVELDELGDEPPLEQIDDELGDDPPLQEDPELAAASLAPVGVLEQIDDELGDDPPLEEDPELAAASAHALDIPSLTRLAVLGRRLTPRQLPLLRRLRTSRSYFSRSHAAAGLLEDRPDVYTLVEISACAPGGSRDSARLEATKSLIALEREALLAVHHPDVVADRDLRAHFRTGPRTVAAHARHLLRALVGRPRTRRACATRRVVRPPTRRARSRSRSRSQHSRVAARALAAKVGAGDGPPPPRRGPERPRGSLSTPATTGALR